MNPLRPYRPLTRATFLAAALIIAGSSAGHAQELHPLAPDELPWRQSGPGLEIAIVDGDPSVVGQPYTMMLRLADGAWIPPHTHNVAKRLLVLTGTLLVGHGATLDSSRVQTLRSGSFLLMPADHPHYEGGRGQTVVALYGIGPLRTTFLKSTP
jgi:quercetin dioxygenase-like cupin family protein